jgi:CxxC motif-containing protein
MLLIYASTFFVATISTPVHIGDVLLSDAAATGVDIVATKNVEA